MFRTENSQAKTMQTLRRQAISVCDKVKNYSTTTNNRRPRSKDFLRSDDFFSLKMHKNKNYVYICTPEVPIQGAEVTERCRSGRSGRTRNAVYGQLYRGFESLSLR